jgi:FkbM family methyltransferase
MQGATGNLYVGLLEFEPMGFVLHALRPHDLLLDVGANVGVYTVLAGGACGADVIAFEPVSTTVSDLEANIRINGLSERVEVRRSVVGRTAGSVDVSIDRDSTNHVISSHERAGGPLVEATESARVERLDDVDVTRARDGARVFIKVDVEGFEVDVLEGAEALLSDPGLLAVIIEINGSGDAFGHSDAQIFDNLGRHGLTEITYDPTRRTLIEQPSHDQTRIFVRDISEVRHRIETAPRVRLGIGVVI